MTLLSEGHRDRQIQWSWLSLLVQTGSTLSLSLNDTDWSPDHIIMPWPSILWDLLRQCSVIEQGICWPTSKFRPSTFPAEDTTLARQCQLSPEWIEVSTCYTLHGPRGHKSGSFHLNVLVWLCTLMSKNMQLRLNLVNWPITNLWSCLPRLKMWQHIEPVSDEGKDFYFRGSV